VTQTPTGRIECTDSAPMLILERRLPASIDVVWAALTESDRTARWIGSWTGEPGAGNPIHVTWTAEEGAPTEEMTIVACEPPRLLTISGGPNPDFPYLTTVELFEEAEGTRLEFRQPMWGDASPAMLGTGWEFYLDRLTGALAGDEDLPTWDNRYFAMQPHYEELHAAMATCGDRSLT
jgi:uncharacterized protein YndB with AHSA1/START domain